MAVCFISYSRCLAESQSNFARLTLELSTIQTVLSNYMASAVAGLTKSNVWLDILLLLSLRLWLSTTIAVAATTIEAKIKKHDYLFVMLVLGI